jgi:hypothetical protein
MISYITGSICILLFQAHHADRPVLTVKHSQIRDLRDKRYKGSDDEWEAVLASILLVKTVDPGYAPALKDVELVATEGKECINFTIHRELAGGITVS